MVATQIGSPAQPLVDAAREAFVSGMEQAIWVGVGVAILGAVLTVLFLPARPTSEPRIQPAEHVVTDG